MVNPRFIFKTWAIIFLIVFAIGASVYIVMADEMAFSKVTAFAILTAVISLMGYFLWRFQT